MIYKLAKTRNRRTKDISDNIYISDADGNILTNARKEPDLYISVMRQKARYQE